MHHPLPDHWGYIYFSSEQREHHTTGAGAFWVNFDSSYPLLGQAWVRAGERSPSYLHLETRIIRHWAAAVKTELWLTKVFSDWSGGWQITQQASVALWLYSDLQTAAFRAFKMLKELHSPSSSLVKDRLVVSSFRFLLKSMHRLLSFFLMVLISCDSRERSQVRPYIKLKNTFQLWMGASSYSSAFKSWAKAPALACPWTNQVSWSSLPGSAHSGTGTTSCRTACRRLITLLVTGLGWHPRIPLQWQRHTHVTHEAACGWKLACNTSPSGAAALLMVGHMFNTRNQLREKKKDFLLQPDRLINHRTTGALVTWPSQQ